MSIARVADLPAEWERQAGEIDALGDAGEGGRTANRRVAASLRACASALRAVQARQVRQPAPGEPTLADALRDSLRESRP